jgi:hypothetical protein
MKLLKILICSMLPMMIFGSSSSLAQSPSVRAGIYDFVGNTASEFYVLAPTVIFGYDVWKRSQMNLEMSAGFSYNRIKYNSHHHHLFMIPLMTTVYYNLPDPGARAWPEFGLGISFLGKADHNIDFNKTHYSLAYGYHATGRLNVPLKENLLFTFDMTWNLLIPPELEEVNLSGVILTVGLSFLEKHGNL